MIANLLVVLGAWCLVAVVLVGGLGGWRVLQRRQLATAARTKALSRERALLALAAQARESAAARAAVDRWLTPEDRQWVAAMEVEDPGQPFTEVLAGATESDPEQLAADNLERWLDVTVPQARRIVSGSTGETWELPDGQQVGVAAGEYGRGRGALRLALNAVRREWLARMRAATEAEAQRIAERARRQLPVPPGDGGVALGHQTWITTEQVPLGRRRTGRVQPESAVDPPVRPQQRRPVPHGPQAAANLRAMAPIYSQPPGPPPRPRRPSPTRGERR